MPTPGEPRLASRAGVLVVVLLAIGGAWWWRHRGGEPPATHAVTQPAQAPAAHPGRGEPAAPAATAALTVTVTDDAGPLAGAVVRLAPGDGEVVAITTGRDGTARADHLTPGTWRISASAAGHAPAALPPHPLAAGADDRLAIRLAAGGRTLSGTVSDATGGPIAGARIDAARIGSFGDPGDAVAATLTGADGKYRLTVAEGALLVAASSPDYAPQARRVEVGPTGAVADFALVPGGVIEGVVRDERSREPVAGASVLARRGAMTLLAEPGARRAITDGDGRFRLAGLAPGAWSLQATAGPRALRDPVRVGLGVAEQVTGVELLIGARPVIRGHVVDDAGAAVPGIAVRARGRGEGTEATADATGGFVLEGLRPGSYSISARGDTYLSAGDTRVALADKDVDGVVVTVRRGVTLRGHVEPRQVCDVQRDLAEPLGPMAVPPVTTAADGEFQLGPFDAGDTRLTARCPSGDEGATTVKVARGAPDVVLRVTPGGSIAGRVVDGAGKPVAGIGVIATEISRGEHITIRNGAITSGAQAATDGSGAYQIGGLAPGTYRLGALDRGRSLALRGEPPSVELAASEHKTGVDLAIDRPDGVISGTVTGPDGTPVADVWVSAVPDLLASLTGGPRSSGMRTVAVDRGDGAGGDTSLPPALTDAQGHYAIRGLTPATYAVVAEAQRGQLRARVGDVHPDATVDLRLTALGSLSGTVTGPGGPTALFSVDLDGPSRNQRSFTDGKFAFDHLDPGSYTVRVQSSEGSGQARVDVPADRPASVAITLDADAVVIGRLVDPAGAPLAGQAVAVTEDHGDGTMRIQLDGPPPTTSPDGRFRIEHRAGPCVLVVLRPQAPFRRGLTLVAGQTLDLGTVTVGAADHAAP
ncbi:MAG TPA: carboxypeptidase-like regulatory domain-containing protein [Kofleriaceae bacterium]|jgi:protocatechuate 3,4-dioxygenase beta subunit|nr:carboxypeptidase-like regulatory domain-containing protein [Kofleriaceae bacterium]